MSRLVAPVRSAVATISLAGLQHPAEWRDSGLGLYVVDHGSSRATFQALGAARYGFWLGGAFFGRVELAVDGRPLANMRHQLEWGGQYVRFGATSLQAGRHHVDVSYESGGIRPGTVGVAPLPLGPLAVAVEASPRLLNVPASAARSLCGRRLDWIEALRR